MSDVTYVLKKTSLPRMTHIEVSIVTWETRQVLQGVVNAAGENDREEVIKDLLS